MLILVVWYINLISHRNIETILAEKGEKIKKSDRETIELMSQEDISNITD